MLRYSILRQTTQRVLVRFKSDKLSIEELEAETIAESPQSFLEEPAKLSTEEIERKRNKSRLATHHFNIVHNKPPYKEPVNWYHNTLRFKRKSFGAYGTASGVDPALCFPIQQELNDVREYEQVAYPFGLKDMIENAKKLRENEAEEIQSRQRDIISKMAKLEQIKQEHYKKLAKKEADLLAAKSKKDRLVEEVRRQFGYSIDPNSEKFKELLEKKEKEQKKADKTAKKKAREDRMIAQMLNKKIDENNLNEKSTKENVT